MCLYRDSKRRDRDRGERETEGRETDNDRETHRQI